MDVEIQEVGNASVSFTFFFDQRYTFFYFDGNGVKIFFKKNIYCKSFKLFIKNDLNCFLWDCCCYNN